MFTNRKPDLIIGPVDNPYLKRWHLFRWRGIQVSLHLITRDDDDRALHDHSGDNLSILLTGRYIEVLSHKWEPLRAKLRRRFIPYFRRAEQPHRLMLENGKPVWTIWFRWPPRREWGFWCPKGWLHWTKYVAERGGYYKNGVSTVGQGCD